MPSQFEPCGLSQMISLRYGTVPIVRETGGLRDTVLAYNEYTGSGNGFTFFNYNAHDMLHTIQRALHLYWNKKDVWEMLMLRGMSGDYSWTHSAEMYMSLYQSILPGHEIPVAPQNQAPETLDRVQAHKVPASTGILREGAALPAATSKPAVKKAAAKKAPVMAAGSQETAPNEKASPNLKAAAAEEKAPKAKKPSI
jgi:hypothetical protein